MFVRLENHHKVLQGHKFITFPSRAEYWIGSNEKYPVESDQRFVLIKDKKLGQYQSEKIHVSIEKTLVAEDDRQEVPVLVKKYSSKQ